MSEHIMVATMIAGVAFLAFAYISILTMVMP
jgi:hypothetical protein